MSDIMGGLGSIAEGGLFSRALEPDSGAKEPHPNQPDECLNCGTPLTGAYCQACGQAGHVHRTIRGFMHDLMHGALHLEGKLWRTLPMLIFRPGRLTRRYIDGERARFVSPMAFFLFAVFLMFAVFQIAGITTPTDLSGSSISTSIDQTEEQARADIAEAEARRDAAQQGSTEYQQAVDDIATSQAALDGMAQARIIDFEDNPNMRITGIENLDEGVVKKWRENPGLMLYKLQANAYKFSWLLIPISIPFVWVLFFWKRRFKAYDHAIFVTYSLSFMTLLFIVTSALLAAGVPPALPVLTMVFLPPVHLYKHIKYTYETSRFGAFWRLNVLSVFIWIAIVLFLQVLFLLGAF